MKMVYIRELCNDIVNYTDKYNIREFRKRMGTTPVSGDFGITPLQQILSSCSGALITSLLVTPLDVVKIRLQAQQKEFAKKKCFLYCNGLMEHVCYCNGSGPGSAAVAPSQWFKKSSALHFTGTLDAFAKIIKHEGAGSLWSGLPPTLVMAIPATVIYFTIYDQLKIQFCRNLKCTKENQPLWIPVVAGGMARTISATVISPIELVRTKMQSKNISYWELGNSIKSSVQSQGYLSLWRGLGPTILRDVPFSSLYWLNYEFFKQRYKQTDPTFWFSFTAGATAGTIAAVITLPFDVVKTHRQIELGEKVMEEETKKGTTRLSSTSSLLRTIYSKQGIPGLFAGIVPRIVKIAPACAIMVSTYEFGKAFFTQYNQEMALTK
ncbi:Solute carrier family 25 member 40 [Halotydeus destructor]|nr:Solute carrier family 25 member 40 [Halotydeus destructor]